MIDPITGVITSGGTEREIIEAVRNRDRHIECQKRNFDAQRRTGPVRLRGLQESFWDDPIGVVLFMFVVLSFGVLFLVHGILSLPRSVLISIAIIAGIGILYCAVKLCFATARSFAHSPVRTSILVLLTLAAFGWTGSRIYGALYNSHRTVQLDPSNRSGQVFTSERNGVTLFQLFAVPDKWSAAVVIPDGHKGVQLRSGGPIRVSVNGTEASGGHYQPKTGDSLTFRSAQNITTPLTIRVFMRPPTNADAHTPIALPSLASK